MAVLELAGTKAVDVTAVETETGTGTETEVRGTLRGISTGYQKR
jgi:hypothetical protein